MSNERARRKAEMIRADRDEAPGHTPGPWTAVQARNEYGDCYSRIVADREVDGACIAATITVPGDDREAMEADAADARLIAAAPDLLAALDAIESEAFHGEGGPVEALDACTRIIALARAALARAEGGAQ